MKLAGALMFASTLMIGGAQAGVFYSGNDLLDMCNGKSQKGDENLCVGFIAGVADSLGGDYTVEGDSVRGVRACMPNSVSVGEIKDVARQSLEHNPQVRHLAAVTLVAAALSQAFPCPARL